MQKKFSQQKSLKIAKLWHKILVSSQYAICPSQKTSSKKKTGNRQVKKIAGIENCKKKPVFAFFCPFPRGCGVQRERSHWLPGWAQLTPRKQAKKPKPSQNIEVVVLRGKPLKNCHGGPLFPFFWRCIPRIFFRPAQETT